MNTASRRALSYNLPIELPRTYKKSVLKTYIIDGYNLLWKLLPEKMELAELEGSRQELEGKLVEFISLVGEATVILVYDGKGGGSKLSRNR